MPKAKKSIKKKAKKTSKLKVNKAAFVRELPPDMPAKDVVKKAKAKGLEMKENYVYRARSLGDGKKRSASKKMAKTKKVSTTRNPRGKPPEKREHLLKLVAEHPDWTANEIAKAVPCSPSYVFTNWGKSRSPRKTGRRPVATGTTSSDVTEFCRLVKKLGVALAKELLENIEAYENA